ncbi:hypothetical protein LINPERHAP2_LOCUS26874, partial [Linum perenne]
SSCLLRSFPSPSISQPPPIPSLAFSLPLQFFLSQHPTGKLVDVGKLFNSFSASRGGRLDVVGGAAREVGASSEQRQGRSVVFEATTRSERLESGSSTCSFFVFRSIDWRVGRRLAGIRHQLRLPHGRPIRRRHRLRFHDCPCLHRRSLPCLLPRLPHLFPRSIHQRRDLIGVCAYFICNHDVQMKMDRLTADGTSDNSSEQRRWCKV